MMPYNVAMLSRYPPMEGGIASKTFWLARGLASRGHRVHVITHPPSAAGEYQIRGNEISPTVAGAVCVHYIEGEMPWHLPEDGEQSLALLNLTMRVIREHQVQIVDTGYLVPYGIVGHLAKMSTGVHHVIRHGGSDLEKFLKTGVLRTILGEAISEADAVITDIPHKSLLEPLASHLVCQPPYIADGAVFRQGEGDRRPHWRLASIGKINYHWQHKGLQLVAEIMSTLKDRFECWIVGQGNGMSDFQRSLSREVSSSIRWRPFVPPWEMPDLLNRVDAIFIFESGLPHPVISNLALEAMCCGIGIITDRSDFARTYQGLVTVGSNQILVLSSSEPSSAAEMITQWVAERAGTGQPSRQLVNYQEYLSATEAVYEGLLSSRQS